MNPLVVIPARGGSKGVPNKNIKLLDGKPLIHYTIEAARAVFPDKIIYVSTDCERIKGVTESIGLNVPFLRPAHLATDTAGTYEVLLHAVDFAERQDYYPDVIVLLQPTSPFRTAQHIKEALENYSPDFDMVVSVKETKSNPYYLLFEEDENGYLKKSKGGDFIRRQDCPKVWELNGAIYIINNANLKQIPPHKMAKKRKYVMNEMTSHEIDTKLDWLIAETLIKRNENSSDSR